MSEQSKKSLEKENMKDVSGGMVIYQDKPEYSIAVFMDDKTGEFKRSWIFEPSNPRGKKRDREIAAWKAKMDKLDAELNSQNH